MTLSNNDIKRIVSLRQKKYRQELQLFIAEGVKVVCELLESDFVLDTLVATQYFETTKYNDKVIRVSQAELKKISQLKTPNKVLAVFQIPRSKKIKNSGIVVALDNINDPGNLGTIIRLCDWFGVDSLVCSEDTVDCFNSKVVQASMGSLSRVNVVYTHLKTFLQATKSPIFIADMHGENAYQKVFPKDAILVMGNEANGVSNEIEELVQHKIAIPQFGENKQTESLNVATATAILLSEFKRAF